MPGPRLPVLQLLNFLLLLLLLIVLWLLLLQLRAAAGCEQPASNAYEEQGKEQLWMHTNLRIQGLGTSINHNTSKIWRFGICCANNGALLPHIVIIQPMQSFLLDEAWDCSA